MLVTLQYGPLAGQERHVERNQLTQLLLDLYLIEAVQTPAPSVQTGPTFSLATGEQGRCGIRCNYPSGETRMLIPPDGFTPPTREAAALYFGNTVWDPTAGTEGKQVKKPLPVPDDVWKRFLSAYGV